MKQKGHPITRAYTYACLGKLNPFGHESFSFNMLSRVPDLTDEEANAKVADVGLMTMG